jgi:hypothetical protein
MSRAPSRFSILLTALETVALESFSSAVAPANERISTTLAKIARPSKSGFSGARHSVDADQRAVTIGQFIGTSCGYIVCDGRIR